MLNRFRPRIHVAVSPELVSFMLGSDEVRLAPVARVAPDGKFIEVGEEARTGAGGTLVEFFKPDRGEVPEGDQRWEEAFTNFCRYGLSLALLDNASILKPRVVVTGAREMRRVLGGRPAVLLERVLRAAGASSVEFGEAS